MNKLEERVKANKIVLDQRFVKKETDFRSAVNQTKIGFSDGWNNGWSNHGGPALTGTTKKETKYGFSKGWDKGWGNYGGPPFNGIKIDNKE